MESLRLGAESMLTISIVFIILVTTAIFYSLCRISSRSYRHLYSTSIVFVHQDDRKHFGDLFLNGDVEGIHRVLQVLQKRELLEIIETGEEIYLVNHNPASLENFHTVPRGLCVSDYNPVEDLRTLRASNNGYGHVPSYDDRRVTNPRPIPAYGFQEIAGDLFMSDFDVLETLKHLSPQIPFASASQAS
jgi:hypothetical protein